MAPGGLNFDEEQGVMYSGGRRKLGTYGEYAWLGRQDRVTRRRMGGLPCSHPPRVVLKSIFLKA